MRLPRYLLLLADLLVLAGLLLVFAPEGRASSRDLPTGGASIGPTVDSPRGPPVHVAVTPDRPLGTESSTTAQSIVQVQISGCVSHCRGGTETQSAQQLQTTIQSVGDARPQRRSVGSSSHMRRVLRGQIGCLAHCSGTTTRGISVNGRRRTLAGLLRALGPRTSPTPVPSPATTQSAVHQASYQWQRGKPAPRRQTQRAAQTSITIQSAPVTHSVIAKLNGALGGSNSPVAAAVNQTVQRIWQLQIGCLFDCSHTRQLQQAKQSNITFQVVARNGTAGGAVAADNTAQSIWELQVGCLIWCVNATELQSAGSRHTTLTSNAEVTATHHAGSIHLESTTVLQQTGGSAVAVTATSQQLTTAGRFRPSSTPRNTRRQIERNRSPAHPSRRRPLRESRPPALIVASRLVSGPAATADVVLGALVGTIVLLAMIAASRVASRRLRQ